MEKIKTIEELKNTDIYCRLVGRQGLSSSLDSLVYEEVMDLVVIYYIKYMNLEDESVNLIISKSMLESWGLTKEQLKIMAWENTIRDKEAVFTSLSSMLASYADIKAFVVTNKERKYGAVTLLYPGKLEEIGRQIRSDYYILPASIHECIVVPVGESSSPEELRQMVESINRQVVSKDEVLSDNVYIYERGKKSLKIAR